MRSCRSISPTDRCDPTSRLNIARRFGSAMISNTDSTLFVYPIENIRVKVYKEKESQHSDKPARPVQRAARDRYGSEPFSPFESKRVSSPHARNTLEHNCVRLAVAHLGRLKRRTASAISAT